LGHRDILAVCPRLPVLPGKMDLVRGGQHVSNAAMRTCSRWNCGALRRMVNVLVGGEEEYLAS
jgi:hypothetical protein